MFANSFRSDPGVEASFCHFGICDSAAALAAKERLLGANSAAALSPGNLLGYLARDPAVPYNWCDLGQSFQKAGSPPLAQASFARALVLGPHIPSVLLCVAHFNLDVGEAREGIQRMAQAIASDPSFAPAIFANYEQKKIPVENILAYGLPDRRAFQEYLRLQIEEKNLQSAAKVWEEAIRRGVIDEKLAEEYVEFLAGRGRNEAAVDAWATYSGRNNGYPDSNRVFNGDFASDPAAIRFDWRIDPPRGVAIDFDRSSLQPQARALRIQMDGTQNLTDAGVRQTVLLRPGWYRFRAYVRTENVTTDEGISFRITDEQSGKQVNFTTEAIVGSHEWTSVEHVFEAPPGVGLVRIGLVRKPSLKFDCLIRGTIWINQVTISPEERTPAIRRR